MFLSGTKKCIRVSCLLISIALLITVLPALVSADSNETIVIGNTVANPATSFSLPIFVENVTNMNSLSMDLIFDSSLLSVDRIVANDTFSGSELTYYLNNSSGFANMTLSSVDVTAEEKFHVADILFSALASGYSDITAENVSLENNTMLYSALFVFNGSVRVNHFPLINNIDDKVITAGSELSFLVSATDADDSELIYDVKDLPSGYNFNSATGDFVWTPTEADIGTHNANYSVSDGYAVDFTHVNITVNELIIADNPPQLEPVGNKSVNENETLTFTITANDPDDDTVKYSAFSLPANSSLEEDNGNFTWVTDFDDEGVYYVEFIASANGLSDSEISTIVVTDVNRAPKISNIKSQTVSEGSTLEFRVEASDPDGDELDFQMSGLPNEATLNADTGDFSWTPDYNSSGTYSVTFTVSDGQYSDSKIVSITVFDVNRAPFIEPIPDKLVNEDEELIIYINASDVDGDSLDYSKDVDFGTLVDNVFSWTPDYTDSGIYDVKFSVSDGDLSYTEALTIAVGNTNVPPVLGPIGGKSVDENQVLSFTINATDADSGDNLIYKASGLPSGASFDADSHIFSWTPSYSQAGTYSVVFEVSDGMYADTELVTIIVNNTNRPPVLSAIGDKTVVEGSQLSFTISGTDPDSDSLIYSASGVPSGARFSESNREFIWTPTFDDSGTYIVTFTVSDGSLSDSETITINVGSVNRAPELDPIGDKIVSEGSELSFIITGRDPDPDSLKYSVSKPPSGAEFDTATREFTWTPGYDDSNTYSVTFTVNDGILSDSETININVVDVNRAPMLMVIGSQSVDENKLLTITMDATDDDDDTLYYSLVDSPSGSEIDEYTGIFTWTPTYEQDGSYLIRFVVSDGLLEDTEDVTITVKDINRPPVLNIPELVSVSENTTLIQDLDASDPDDDILEYSKDVSFGTLQEDVFSWKPGYEDEGVYSVTFTVSDAEFEVSKTLKINVTNSNSAPVLYSISDILVNELETVTINLTAVDIDDDELEFSKDVEYGSISGNIFTWTPGINDSGFHKILFTVSDGQLSDSKLATIAVGNTNIPPVIVHTGIQQVRENEMLTFTLNASDADGEMLTYSCAELPAGANIERTNGTFTWIPTYEQAGTYTVELMVSDKIYTAVDAVVIKVENVNRAPVFDSIPTHTVNETETLVIHLDASDQDNDGITFSTTAENGKVIGNTFTWTPGYFDSGDYDIDFKVTDGYLTDNTTVHVEVYQTNMPPEIEDMGSYSVYENNTLQFFVKATDGDNDSLTYSVSGLPGGASFNISTGQFTWKPSYTQSGTYSVEFQVTDGELNSSEAVSIRVYDVDLSSDADFSGFETSSSGSSGGGSSSGAEDYNNVAYKDYSIKYVTKGMDIVFEFPNAENDLEYVKFHAVKAAGQVKAIIEILKERSSLVSSNPPGDVYRNINIWVGDAKFNSAGYMSSAEISFKVEKKWLTDNNADPSSIRLYRYSGGSWNELKTSRIGMDAKYYYYKAQTPGFSPFSIVSTGSIPVSVNTATKSTVENVQYSYDADTRLESTGSDSDAAVMDTALEPRSSRPVNTGIVFIGIIGIIAIGSVLGYKSRNESVVLSRYYGALCTFSIGLKNAARWIRLKLGSESLHKDYAFLSGKLTEIKTANYRAMYNNKIAKIKERQKQ